MEIIHTDLLGGTFESCFGNLSDPAGVCSTLGIPGGGVLTDAIFTVIGGDPSNPLELFFSAASQRLAVSGLNGLWEHDGSADDSAFSRSKTRAILRRAIPSSPFQSPIPHCCSASASLDLRYAGTRLAGLDVSLFYKTDSIRFSPRRRFTDSYSFPSRI